MAVEAAKALVAAGAGAAVLRILSTGIDDLRTLLGVDR
jgi:hypothetical protein